jgi:hypothetical protein
LMPRRHPQWISNYYRSDAWHDRKSAYYKRHQRQCAACGRRGGRIDLHHLLYADDGFDLPKQTDWGKEPDQALMPLCGPRWLGFIRGCHFNAHDAEASGRFRDLRAATEEIVRLGRRRRARQRKLGV